MGIVVSNASRSTPATVQVQRRHEVLGRGDRDVAQCCIYRKPNTSNKHPAHAVYPYLLLGISIERANHVWAMVFTYIPMTRGFVHLAAVLYRASRRVMGHRVSITMEVDFCVEALREAIHRSVRSA